MAQSARSELVLICPELGTTDRIPLSDLKHKDDFFPISFELIKRHGDEIALWQETSNTGSTTTVGIRFYYVNKDGREVEISWFDEVADIVNITEEIRWHPPIRAPRVEVAAPDWLPTLVDVATYVGVAGLGGIIGNRADAAIVTLARPLFTKVIARWRERHDADESAPAELTADEAADAARGAVLAKVGKSISDPARLRLVKIELLPDGDQRCVLRYRPANIDEEPVMYSVLVPAGDPAKAWIVLWLPRGKYG